LDFSTVLTVVDHVMLYPTMWLMRAKLIGNDIPEKKIEKKGIHLI